MSNRMIFIGSIYPSNVLEDIIKEQTHADFAAHTFQMGMLEGLSQCYNKIQVITSPVTTTYPNSQKSQYHRKKYELNLNKKEIPVTFTGFINFPFLKLISEYIRVRRELKKQLKGNDVVYVYALHTPFLLVVYSLKKHISKICVIIPDLLEHMSHNNGVIRQFLKAINKRIVNRCLKAFQYYVLFSRFMASELSLEGKKWIVVEGMYAASVLPQCVKETKKTILYSGIISKRYGVFDLIEAFYNIDSKDYQLWICGSCDDFNKLNEYIQKDKRVKYLGMLQKNEVRTLQMRATLLVNPRHSYEEFTKFSFPSKTLEYLASGTPTLMCPLPAIPEEYNEHLFYFNDESIDGYRIRIEEICSMDPTYLRIKSEKARNFILYEKNCFAQAKRIYYLVEK